ncbi:NAD dependent epimerase/dehydratase family protein [Lophiotrema nucula]|uniref:NAD dependent epimerase/dehydratase family protein n=1 Tax=Lophiotrema nucula TaxID=690887 RepID=A0A6A5ZTT5_9PLEO|nr:NAD dependent epimerase/dehydratase family protein [Lophiotrema nucula]
MPTVPPGGLILVTGANGYIAGASIQVFLDKGYKVRGTVRNAEKNQWMLKHYGPNFSLASVPEMGIEGAFDEVVKGVDGIAHIASAVVFKPDPKEVIPPMITSAVGILKSAAKEPRVKSVVYTSSQAASVPIPTMYQAEPYELKEWTYYEDSKEAWTLPQSSEFPRMLLNYAASKLEAEQASWAWVKENKPNFTFNVVVPNINFGAATSPLHTGFGSSAGLLKLLWQGHTIGTTMIPSQWFIDVDEDGLLHLAALTLPDVANERIYAMVGKFLWNDILAIFRKEAPDRKFIDDLEEKLDQGVIHNERSLELLKRLGQTHGFNSLEVVIKKWIKQMLQVENEEMPETEGDRMAKLLT